ncbi:SDR family oxidoreductase [Flavobacteriaceae bacterium 14752]|uniref:SDR family oxidoreductase n=1 Tax=Mesohalobacter salilacus TaxID=2491711 RepID=UPI000F644FD9|nr:SDR family oxidoreductase [Flavobacteriaceae bacterium 14752]
MRKRKKVLVAGANGTTGKIIIDLLKESEVHQPIAMVRKQNQKDHIEKQGVTTVLADLEKDLSQAVKDTDKVIFAAGSKGKNIIDVDQEGAKNLIDATKEAGLEKFVMLSTMGAENPAKGGDLKDYLRAKQNADDYLKASGLNHSIVRPGRLTDEDGTDKIQINKKLGVQGSISRTDVARTLVEALDDDIVQNGVFEITAGNKTIKKAVRSV